MNITSRRLRELRENKKLSQGDVAKFLGISRPTYVGYETGTGSPIRKIKELAALFNVTTDYILGTDIPQKATNPPHFSINNDYTDDEKELIEIYRKLPDSVKSFVKTTVESYLDKENAKKTAKRDGA